MLRTTLIQSDLYWQDIGANLAMFEEKIWKIEDETDLIILPEMFNTGFSMSASELAEPENFTTFRWMKQMAKQTNAAVIGSYIIKESSNYYNRLYFVEPDGSYGSYDKRHLFRMGKEHLTYAPGKKRMIRNFRGWKIMPQICYDLRFPVWNRNRYDLTTSEFEYDLLIFVANWPAPRIAVWDSLLKARALENQCFSIGVNRTGSDGEGIDYNGNSIVYNYKGQPMYKTTNQPFMQTVELDLTELQSFRNKFPVYLDWDKYEIDPS